jgi:hypothetical protein
MTGDYFDALATTFNERTFRHIQAVGIGEGWRCGVRMGPQTTRQHEDGGMSLPNSERGYA